MQCAHQVCTAHSYTACMHLKNTEIFEISFIDINSRPPFFFELRILCN